MGEGRNIGSRDMRGGGGPREWGEMGLESK